MRKVGMIFALLYACGGGAPAPQTTPDAGDHSSDGGSGSNGGASSGTDGGTATDGSSDGSTGTPACSPAGTVKCSGDGDGDGKGDGNLIECNPSYGWSLQQTCPWTCQDGTCGVCALERQPCRYSSDCKNDGNGLMTCVEVGGSEPCGFSNATSCICIYNGYTLGCVQSMECAPGYYCASDSICRPGCYPKYQPCFADDQCCSGKCQMRADQCNGDCS